ncbi:porin [Cupriavidus lacunae]|uniref:Porin n=1 Tax=Cupriavidus lacunae TaxID=2666307 RepID=A0A370NWM0_9BURK|nr:porin [Cupriavidus lacunae]RDK09986.1 porin [Cupriavidus lacunae]
MQKTILAVAACCACGAVQAQSSVTLYGVADANVEYVNHVGAPPQASNNFNPGPANNVFRENSGGLSGSRWGLRGTEDLGGGLKSVFALEGGFNIDSGLAQQGGRLFGRQAFVGLQTNYGQLIFGRQYTSLFSTVANFVPARFATQYEPAALITGFNYREDNTVKYTGVFGPLTAMAHWTFGAGLTLPRTSPTAVTAGGNGEVPGEFRRDTGYGAALSYGAGLFRLGVGYDQWNPTIGTGSGTYKKAAVMANFGTDKANVSAGYRWGQNRDQNGALLLRDDFYWVGGNYKVLNDLTLTLEYNYQDVKSLAGSPNFTNPWQIAFIADYALSKRTDVYLTTAYAKHAGLALDSAATGYATSLALGNSYALGAGQSSMLGVALGIRHIF